MKNFDIEKVLIRFHLCLGILVVIVLCVLGQAFYIMTAKRSYWLEVASRVKKDSVIVLPNRGNILSSEGFLMASSLPEYKLYMDFKALKEAGNDSLWHAKIDSVCNGLNVIFPTKKASEFKKTVDTGLSGKNV